MRLVTVVRTNGERTAKRCEQIVREQCDDVEVIRAQPFVEAVRQCFRVAIDRRADWLLTVDADMTLHPTAAGNLVKIAGEVPESVWQFQGQMTCKLYMGPRACGPRMYRVEALPKALDLLTDAVRPEAELTRAMSGFQKVGCNTGLHDFEQWRRDLHRKGAAHREKHPNWKHIANRWISGDDDLKAAWQGWHRQPLTVRETHSLDPQPGRAIVVYCWPGRGYRPEHVNRLAALCKVHAPGVRFVCVMEGFNEKDFSADVDLFPMPPEAMAVAGLKSPEGTGFPSSYRRLATLSEWGRCLGEEVLVLDIDCVPCASLLPYFGSRSNFVGWRPKSVWGRKDRIAGGTWFHRTGTLTHLWKRFAANPVEVIRQARVAGFRGSDQGVLSLLVGADVEVWPEPHGIYQGQDHNRREWRVPDDARLIHFNGDKKPWLLLHLPWVRKLYEPLPS